jgi:hypothetical protein
MTSGAQTREGQLVEASWGLTWHSSGLLGGHPGSMAFWVLRWMTPGMILGEVALRCGFL